MLQPPEILFMFQNLGNRHLTIGKRCVQICNSKKKKSSAMYLVVNIYKMTYFHHNNFFFFRFARWHNL